jgi:hypothetical protein
MAAAARLYVGLSLRGEEATIISFGYSAEFYVSLTCVFLHLLLQLAYVPLDLLPSLGLSRLRRLSFPRFLI